MKLMLVGCGAIAEQFFVPAFKNAGPRLQAVTLVDSNLERARKLADANGMDAAGSIDGKLAEMDAVIVATPNNSHYPLAKRVLEAGKHCLVEKPVTLFPQEARELADLADRKKVVLAVNQTRRFFPALGVVRDLIASGKYGAVKHIVHAEGAEFKWPTVSGFYFSKGAVRTGVLMDMGAHIFDIYRWLLQKPLHVIETRHDGFDGPEAVMRARLGFDTGEADIALSRFYRLKNRFEIHFEGATVSADIFNFNAVTVMESGGARRVLKSPRRISKFPDLGNFVVEDFLASIAAGSPPRASGRDACGTIDLLDAAYRQATHFDLPWYRQAG